MRFIPPFALAAAAFIALAALAAFTAPTSRAQDAPPPPPVTLTPGAGLLLPEFANPAASANPAAAATLPSSALDILTANPANPAAPTAAPAAPAAPLAPDPRAFLFEAQPDSFSRKSYAASVAALFAEFEKSTGKPLKPGPKRKAVLKLYTSSGPGIATPRNLVAAVIRELERRGFERKNILLADLHERRVRESGYACDGTNFPQLAARRASRIFDGFPVLAFDTGKYYDARWFCESNLPSNEITSRRGDYEGALEIQEKSRKSYFPAHLFQDADLWINLPVAMDSQSLGVSAALANETIWSVSNQRRFLMSLGGTNIPSATAEAAVEIARNLEGSRPETTVLHLLSLERWQYIGGPVFDSSHCVTENRLWLSANPMILDALMLQRINNARRHRNFPTVAAELSVFAKAITAPPKETTPDIRLGASNPAEITLVQVNPATPAAPVK